MTQSDTNNKSRTALILSFTVIFIVLLIVVFKSAPEKDPLIIPEEEEKQSIDALLRQKGPKIPHTLKFFASRDDLWERIKTMKIEITTPMFNEALDSFSTGTELLYQGKRNQNKLNLGRAIHKLNFSTEAIPAFETFYNLGYAYLEFGDYEQALVEFQKALDYEKNHPGLYNGIGLSLIRLGRIEEGLDQLHIGLSIADTKDNKSWKGEILIRLGETYKEKKQINIALIYFQEAIIKSFESGYMEGAVESLYAYSKLRMENKKGKAKEYLTSALDYGKKTGYQVGVAKVAALLASHALARGQKNIALEFCQQALAAYMDLENTLGQAHIFNQIAQIHEQQRNFNEAIKYYQESLLLHRQINHQEGKSRDLGNIGLLYYVKGDLNQALKYYQGALVVHEETGDQQKKSITLGNIGLIYLDKQEVDKALVYLQNAVTLDRRIDFMEGEALHLAHTGKAYLMNKNLQKARESFERSLKLYRDLKNTIGEARQLSHLAQYYSMVKDNPKALKYHLDSLASFQKVANVEGEATQMSKIGMLYREMGEMDNSLKYLNESLKIFEDLHKQTHRKFAGLEPVDLSNQMLTHE